MEEQKKNLDIYVILIQLNIPRGKFEEWNTLEKDGDYRLKSNAWLHSSPSALLYSEK